MYAGLIYIVFGLALAMVLVCIYQLHRISRIFFLCKTKEFVELNLAAVKVAVESLVYFTLCLTLFGMFVEPKVYQEVDVTFLKVLKTDKSSLGSLLVFIDAYKDPDSEKAQYHLDTLIKQNPLSKKNLELVFEDIKKRELRDKTIKGLLFILSVFVLVAKLLIACLDFRIKKFSFDEKFKKKE